MPFNKIQSEGLDLTDNYAFTGTVTGTGAMTLLQTTTASSSSTITFSYQCQLIMVVITPQTIVKYQQIFMMILTE